MCIYAYQFIPSHFIIKCLSCLSIIYWFYFKFWFWYFYITFLSPTYSLCLPMYIPLLIDSIKIYPFLSFISSSLTFSAAFYLLWRWQIEFKLKCFLASFISSIYPFSLFFCERVLFPLPITLFWMRGSKYLILFDHLF